MSGDPRVLCLNGGSSSLKVALFQQGERERLLGTGSVEGIATPACRLRLYDEHRRELVRQSVHLTDHAAAVHGLFDALATQPWPTPTMAGHRLVHGGPDYAEPARVDAALLATLQTLVPYAPLHLPAELAVIEAVRERYPALPQAVCFDTAFHRELPQLAKLLPLPRALYEQGIRRYGFHGLSYEYIVQALGDQAAGRVIIAHLGSGASMAAVRAGEPIDTTMGLTPSGGIMMATRSGDLDPGVLLHLQRERGYDLTRLSHMLEHESGLRGVSDTSADMQTLIASQQHDARASEAVALFCYQVRKQIGAYTAALGGLDTLVFTGGIGAHAAEVRAAACQGLDCLGIELDPLRNAAGEPVISRIGSPCAVRVMVTDEERMIARHTARLIGAQAT